MAHKFYTFFMVAEITADSEGEALAKLDAYREAAARADERYGSGDVAIFRDTDHYKPEVHDTPEVGS